MAISYEYVGKTGGGGKIVDVFEGEKSGTLSFDLPEGRWVVLIDAGRDGSLNPDIALDGDMVFSTSSNVSRVTGAVRGVLGGPHTVSRNNTYPLIIYGVSYFPDPA